MKISEEKDISCLTSSDAQDVVSAGPLNSCSFANCSVKIIMVQYLQYLILRIVVNDRYCIVSMNCVINKNLIKMEMSDLK